MNNNNNNNNNNRNDGEKQRDNNNNNGASSDGTTATTSAATTTTTKPGAVSMVPIVDRNSGYVTGFAPEGDVLERALASDDDDDDDDDLRAHQHRQPRDKKGPGVGVGVDEKAMQMTNCGGGGAAFAVGTVVDEDDKGKVTNGNSTALSSSPSGRYRLVQDEEKAIGRTKNVVVGAANCLAVAVALVFEDGEDESDRGDSDRENAAVGDAASSTRVGGGSGSGIRSSSSSRAAASALRYDQQDDGHRSSSIRRNLPSAVEYVPGTDDDAKRKKNKNKKKRSGGQPNDVDETVSKSRPPGRSKSLLSLLRHCGGSRFRLYASLGFVLLVVAAVFAAVGVAYLRQPPPNDGNGGENALPTPADDEAPSGRERLVEARIRGAIFREESLVDAPDSPYEKALVWISREDPSRLEPGAANLLQRCAAAYFYYSTTQDGPWRTCNPPPPSVVDGVDDPDDTAMSLTSTYCSYATPGGVTIPSVRWLSNVTECDWLGIGCDGEGQVVSIDLVDNDLSGPFPVGIVRNWPFLRSVRLERGNLRGALPPDLVATSSISSIRLSNQKFEGSVPDGWWEGRQLQVLDVGHNELTGTIGPRIANLRDLKTLKVGGNKIGGSLPPEIGALDNLSQLDVSNNNLTGAIPRTVSNWKSIKRLDMSLNKLQGTIPEELLSPGLLSLSLHTNAGLGGELPESLYALTNLYSLELQNCNFAGTLSSKIANLGPGLETLLLSDNQFWGPIPTEFAALADLSRVWLHGNSFTGIVPERWCADRNVAMSGTGLYDIDDDDDLVIADCQPAADGYIELQCSCCTTCCKPGGRVCLPNS